MPAADGLERHVRWADGFVVMYSVTDRASLEEARRLKDLVYTHRHAEVCPVHGIAVCVCVCVCLGDWG